MHSDCCVIVRRNLSVKSLYNYNKKQMRVHIVMNVTDSSVESSVEQNVDLKKNEQVAMVMML